MASKGFKAKSKLSQNQLAEALVALSSRQQMLSSNVSMELHRLNVVVFSLLKELRLVDEKVCEKCDMRNLRPILSEIEIDPHCAECGHRIDPLPDEVFTDGSMMDSEE